MFKKTILTGIVATSFLFSSSLSASAEIDAEGYEYTPTKISEIDFTNLDIYPTLLSGNPGDEDAIYAVYTDEVMEQYKKDQGLENDLIKAVASKGFSYYYNSSKWINRDGMISLSIDPKAAAWTGSSVAGNAFKVKDRFDVLTKKHSGDSQWKNPASLKLQLTCHADLAKSVKTPWNIEPHRTTTDVNYMYANGCNPENR